MTESYEYNYIYFPLLGRVILQLFLSEYVYNKMFLLKLNLRTFCRFINLKS